MSRRPLSLKLSPLAVCLAAALFSLPVDARPLRLHGSGRAADSTISSAPLGGINLPVTSCLDDGSGGTLREVLAAAGEGDTVDLTALACSTITLTQGQLAISLDDVSLVGPGDHETTIDAAAAGGVFSGGPMRIERSTISGNTALHASGAYVYYYSAMTVIDSTISGNTATGSSGGGLRAQSGLDMVNSTVTSNIAVSIGGGIDFGGEVNIRNSTIAFNQAADGGGFGSSASDRTLSLTSTIVALNSAGSGTSDIGGIDSVTGSHNIIMSTTATVPPDTLAGDPGIAPLADNGGPTQTHALLAGSIAIETGANPDALLTDQRGLVRTSSVATDIGAYEVQFDVVFADGFEAAGARR